MICAGKQLLPDEDIRYVVKIEVLYRMCDAMEMDDDMDEEIDEMEEEGEDEGDACDACDAADPAEMLETENIRPSVLICAPKCHEKYLQDRFILQNCGTEHDFQRINILHSFE